jgi:hypothetical protein
MAIVVGVIEAFHNRQADRKETFGMADGMSLDSERRPRGPTFTDFAWPCEAAQRGCSLERQVRQPPQLALAHP